MRFLAGSALPIKLLITVNGGGWELCTCFWHPIPEKNIFVVFRGGHAHFRLYLKNLSVPAHT